MKIKQVIKMSEEREGINKRFCKNIQKRLGVSANKNE